MRVLVTGGAGFIGSHLAESLLKNKYEVSVVDNLSTGTVKNLSHILGDLSFFEGDIRDSSLIDSITKKCDIVIHLAAAVGVQNILNKTAESISTNFLGSEIVMQSALRFDKRLIIASSSEIYGKNPKQPLVESDDRVIGTPQKIRWTYSDAKALEESLAFVLFKEKNLRQTTLRFFNTVGPRQTGRYGMVIPRFVESALRGQPVPVHGDGSQSRVFCHVKDVVEALQLIIMNDTTIGEVFNIGGVGEIRVKELAELIIEKTNSNSTITFTPYENVYPLGYEDMQRRVPDISKIKKMVGWEPRRDLGTIIQDIVLDLTE